MKLNIIIGNHIEKVAIKEKEISKNDLYLTYLNDFIEYDDGFISIGGLKQSKKDYYFNEEPDDEGDDFELMGE